MKLELKKLLKKLLGWFAVIFVILFVFRLIYGYTIVIENNVTNYRSQDNISFSKRNYASKEYIAKQSTTQQQTTIDQKYEKIAEIKAKSTQFEKDEHASRKHIEKYNALIQFEQKSGNNGHRSLNLAIGVPPENFDSLYLQLIRIGTVQAKEITKKDKTNEYKELNAKKKSLEKTHSSLVELKLKGGKIEEYMQLENRILQIEQELQDLGVSLGDFDDENEFCTIKFSLNETIKVNISLLKRIKIALEWTVKICMKGMITLFFLSLLAYFVLKIIDKMKLLQKSNDKNDLSND